MKEKNALTKTLIETLGITANDARQIVGVVLDEMRNSTDQESVSHVPTNAQETLIRNHPAPDGGETYLPLDEGADTVGLFSISQETTAELTVDTAAEHKERLGRYENLGIIGVGGMGQVHLVRDDRLKRTLAMKIIHSKLLNSPRAISRFVEEAQVEAQLQHPNIVPIYEIGELPDGRHYFTMQQIRGMEFSMRIWEVHQASDTNRWRASEDGTTFRDLIRIFQQVCVTLAYAHEQGVIHRDLKPENIMIGGFGEVLVVDWGLAKVLDREHKIKDAEDNTDDDIIQTDRSNTNAMKTRMGSVAGTPCYMPPEQAAGETHKIGKHSDVYSLGAILYEILSGRPPFNGESANDVIDQVKNGAPTSLIPIENSAPVSQNTRHPSSPTHLSLPQTSKIPIPLARICEQAMHRDISLRTATAGILAVNIRDWLEGAEKREKGLKELESAKQYAEQAQERKRLANQLWKEANEQIDRKGINNENGWRRWAESRSARADQRKLWRKHIRTLLGALVHAPELEEAHMALAEIRLEEMVAAAAVGSREEREVLQQQFNGHLQMLPPTKREQLETQLRDALNDEISGLRLRRGTLVGRHLLRQQVREEVSKGKRLLTLLGTAGVGKTRAAIELADELRPHFNRTVFCDLTEANDELGVMRRLARDLNIRLRDTNPNKHLTEILGTSRTLLILDNLEQVREAVIPLIENWISENAELHVITTSRLRLNVTDEIVIAVQPLNTLAGVDLFLRRAQAADGRFELNIDNRNQVCILVQKLDGLPLAIELAAARLNIMSLSQIVERLDERFGILRSIGREARALDGALDWSWELLKPWAKAVLSQSSIFRGGFDLQAAEGILVPGNAEETPPFFDILGELVDNSLLQKNQTEDGPVRYRLLESIRAYAARQLQQSSEAILYQQIPAKEAEQRHAAYFSQMGSPENLSALDTYHSKERWKTLFQELDNLVVAIDYGTVDTAPRCCLAALKVLGMKGPVSLGVDIATKTLEMKGLNRRLTMQLEIERSKCLRISGRMREAREVVRNSVNDSLDPDHGNNADSKPIDGTNKDQ